jgi:hypothetical protein
MPESGPKASWIGTFHEPRLISMLGRLLPDLVPEVPTIDTERAWSLTRDVGATWRSSVSGQISGLVGVLSELIALVNLAQVTSAVTQALSWRARLLGTPPPIIVNTTSRYVAGYTKCWPAQSHADVGHVHGVATHHGQRRLWLQVLVKEVHNSAAGVDGGWLMELRPGEPAQHREENGTISGIMIIEERVSRVGVRLDIVIDPDRREDPMESLPNSPVGGVLRAIAADYGAGAGQEALRVHVLSGRSVIHARRGEATSRSE